MDNSPLPHHPDHPADGSAAFPHPSPDTAEASNPAVRDVVVKTNIASASAAAAGAAVSAGMLAAPSAGGTAGAAAAAGAASAGGAAVGVGAGGSVAAGSAVGAGSGVAVGSAGAGAGVAVGTGGAVAGGMSGAGSVTGTAVGASGAGATGVGGGAGAAAIGGKAGGLAAGIKAGGIAVGAVVVGGAIVVGSTLMAPDSGGGATGGAQIITPELDEGIRDFAFDGALFDNGYQTEPYELITEDDMLSNPPSCAANMLLKHLGSRTTRRSITGEAPRDGGCPPLGATIGWNAGVGDQMGSPNSALAGSTTWASMKSSARCASVANRGSESS